MLPGTARARRAVPAPAGTTALLAATALLLPGSPAAEEGWRFRVTPYVWAPTLDASAGIRNAPKVETNRSVLEILDFAALVTGEARNGRFVILGELNYLDLGSSATGPRGVMGADFDMTGVLGALSLGYAVHATDRARIEGLAGARVWSLDASVDFDRLPGASASQTWVDPIIGVRVTYHVAPNWSVQALGDIGGFGVGSDFQWEAMGRVGYAFGDRFTLAGGWRHLAVDVDRGALELEMTLTGPFVALDIAF